MGCKFKLRSGFTIPLIVLSLLLTAGPLLAATVTVSGGGAALQAAIVAATAGDTINVEDGTYDAINLMVGTDGAAKNLAIYAKGTCTISGTGSTTGAAVNLGTGINATTVISGFTITNSAGTGISMQVNDPNDAAITPEIIGNTITGCTNSGMILLSAQPYLVGNSIYGNSGTNGGGIQASYSSILDLTPLDKKYPSLYRHTNEIYGNTASASGGGIYISCGYGEGALLKITPDKLSPSGFSLSGNSAGENGGAICVEGYAALTANGITESTGGWISIERIGVFDNFAGNGGGGIYINSGGDCLLHQIIFSNNMAGWGGALATADLVLWGSATVNYNAFFDNAAIYGGAAIIWGANTTLRNNTIDGNVADESGGALYMDSEGAEIVSNVIRNNSASRAGAIILRSRERITYNYITENIATDSDGGILVDGSSAFKIQDVIKDNEIRGNQAGGGGGGAAVRGTLNFAMFINNLFEDNSAGDDSNEGLGGGILVDNDPDSYVKVQNCTFVGNAVDGPSGGQGAAAYIDAAAPVDLVNNIIASNLNGGGVYGTNAGRPWIYGFHNNVWSNEDANWAGYLTDKTGWNGNISADPKFALGWDGNYFLSQPNGQATTSPCVNAGGISAIDSELTDAITSTAREFDSGVVDIGFHYRVQDDDADGMPNLYELQPGLGSHPWVGDHPWDPPVNPYFPEWNFDANMDHTGGWVGLMDYDGLTTVVEYHTRTNPQDFDTDADGLSDGDEVTRGTDPVDSDTDDDGVLDGDEVNLYHTDPLTADTGVFGLVTAASDSSPIQGATIRLVQGGVVKKTVQSDIYGAYAANVAAGTYTVTCSKLGYQSQSVSVTVTAGKVTFKNFALDVATGIAGTVTDTHGPVSGATVELLQSDVVQYTFTTDVVGEYSGAVADGTYDVRCSADLHVTQTKTDIALSSSSLTIVDFTLVEISSITGKVTDAVTSAAIEGATIELLQGGAVIYSFTTDSSGNYGGEVDAGAYTVTCGATGYIGQTKTGIVVSAGVTTTNFALAKSAQVSGIVTRAADGAPISGATVKLFRRPSGELLFETSTAADGSYSIDQNVPSGNMSVEVSAPGYITKGALVIFVAGYTYNLNFALEEPISRVQGNIIDSSGKSMAWVNITAYDIAELKASAASNLAGGYALTLPEAGTFTLLVTAPNYYRQAASITLDIGETGTRNFTLNKYKGNPVSLSAPGLTPASGNAATVFTFRVTYRHEWGAAPTEAYLYLKGSSTQKLPMTRVSGDPTIGAVYEYSTTLAPGTYSYSFQFKQGKKKSKLPAKGTYSGPVVTL